MELAKAKQIAQQLMNEHGMQDVPLKISGGKTQLGVCCWKADPNMKANPQDSCLEIFSIPRRRHRRSKAEKIARFKNATVRCIKLSRYLVALNDETEVRQTMLHEIAHAICGCGHGHDDVWRRKAIEIGCDGKRLNKTADMPKGRYQAKCQCSKVYYAHRKGKNILKKNWYSCKTCHSYVNFVDTQTMAFPD
jgi:predicted SprT family Zn-dependent metalloprotease